MNEINQTLAALISANLEQKAIDDTVKTGHVKARIETSITSGGQTQEIKKETPVLATKLYKPKLGYITVDSGASISLGNYNNAKINVHIMLPIGIEITDELRQQIESTFVFAKQYVDEKVSAEVKDMLAHRTGA